MRASGQPTPNFLNRASWRLYEIRQPPTWLCTTSNFLTNTTIETFQAGHLGKHVATTSRRNTTNKVRQDRNENGGHDRRDKKERQDRRNRQDTREEHDWHLNLTFQDTCKGQLSQSLRCFSFAHLNEEGGGEEVVVHHLT